jgi:hypothetical protein
MSDVRAASIALASLIARLVLGGWAKWHRDKEPATPAAERDPELDRGVTQALFDKTVETAAGAIERARTSATFLQGAATAIAGLYTGALGLVFVAKDNPLPARGLAPTVFFGLAVVLAAAYVAFLTRGRGVVEPSLLSKDSSFTRMFIQAAVFQEWTQNAVRQREGFLRASVASLAVGVALLPMAFVTVADEYATSLPWYTPAHTSTPPESDEIVWPEPGFVSPPAVAAIVYQAQIDRFVENLDTPTANDRAENAVTVLLALVGWLFILATLGWGIILNRWKRLFG